MIGSPPANYCIFSTAGDPPVYIGFGSMTGRNPQEFTRLLIDAVQRSGQRAILLSGWAGIGDTRCPLQSCASTPRPTNGSSHAWRRPFITAARGQRRRLLRAGTPTVIVPHIAEQPLWGKRVEVLGVGPKAIPRNKLTAEKLAVPLTKPLTNRAMKQRTVELSQKIRSEDGIGAAIRLIEELLMTR